LLVDQAEQTITMDHQVRTEVVAALASVINVEFRRCRRFRETIIANGRERCEPQYLATFDRIAAQLDERGMRMVKQPKVPVGAAQAVQRVLFDTKERADRPRGAHRPRFAPRT